MTVTGGFIEQCEQEQLHLSGAIQSHGALLVASEANIISHASANITDWLPDDQGISVGQPLPDGLSALAQRLKPEPGSRLRFVNAPVDGCHCSMILTRSKDQSVVFELLPVEGSDPEQASAGRLHHFREFASNDEIQRARERLTEKMLLASGFDRVLYYRFRQDGTGEVLAESVGPAAQGQYLGLRFPASDIPKIARDLYRQSPWRTIPDAPADNIGIFGREDTPPDLSYVDLRSVSPVHRAYMHNMGVVGSASFPVMVAGELAALISCHASRPLRLSLPTLKMLNDQVTSYALALKEFRTRERMNLLSAARTRTDYLKQRITEAGGLVQNWDGISKRLLEEFEADGVVLETGQELLQAGLQAEPETLEALVAWLCSETNERTLKLSDHLQADCPDMPLSEVAGAMALRFRRADGLDGYCMFLRKEETQEIAWGGRPDKPPEDSQGSLGITPRRSFERWLETRMGHSGPWPELAQLKLYKFRELLVELLH